MLSATAFLLLRITIAWLFLTPIPNFLSKWKIALGTVKPLFPKYTTFFTVLMIFGMIAGSISVLFGIYAQIGVVFLCVQCLLGVIAHKTIVRDIKKMQLSASESHADQKTFANAKALGILGHRVSCEKNIMIAAVMIFIMLVGSGPFSVTGNLL